MKERAQLVKLVTYRNTDTARGPVMFQQRHFTTMWHTGSTIAVSIGICPLDHLSGAYWSLCAPVVSMPIASGSWVPVGPVQPPTHKRRRWKTKARSHTPKRVKRSRLDPEHSPTRMGSADAHSNEDNPVDPSQEDNAGPDLSDQDLPMSLHEDMSDFDWVANTRRPECENPLSPGGPGDDLGP